MAPELEGMSEFFDNRAQIYDERHVSMIDGGLESKNIISAFLPEQTKTLLDLGIGTGLELAEIFERFPKINVTGIDISVNMLQMLKIKYPDRKINLYHADYFKYDLGKDRYDVALSVMSLHHYDYQTKTALYRKIYNCLHQSGIYIECDYMLSEFEYENAQETEDSFFAEYERLRNEQALTDGMEHHFDTPCTVTNQKKMLLESGFSHVHEVWRKKNVVILKASV